MTVKRTFKDSVFRKRFNNKEKLIELYNALEGTGYPVDAEVEINTLHHAIYSGVKNDISFVINGEHNVFLEHQSSQPMNVPLKCLLYLGATYTKAMDKKELHRRIIRLPTPKFYVFYNGDQSVPQEQILKLSDSFMGGCGENTVELKVKMININYNESELLERSPHLKDYAYFVHLVKLFKQTSGTLEEAVEKAIDVCINENVMADFLKKNRQEVIGMSLLEGSFDEYLEDVRMESRSEGMALGAYEKAVKTAKNFIQMGVSIEKVSQGTGLSVKEVERLTG